MLRNANLKVVILIVVLIMASSGRFAGGVENAGTIIGVVKNKSGEAVAGATVKIRHVDRGITFTVISQEQGRYKATNLPPGKYTVQGLGGGFQGFPADFKGAVEVDGSRAVSANLVLASPQDFRDAMTSTRLAELMPEGEGKTIIVSLCTPCHLRGLEEVASRRLNGDAWGETVETMRSHPHGDPRSLTISDQQRDVVVDYLTKNFGPEAPPWGTERHLPRTWVTGPAAKSVFTEYDLPSGATPHDVAVDSQGIGWVSESGLGVIGRLDPGSHTYTRFPLPGGKSGATAIAVDEQDQVWAVDARNSRLMRFDPKNETFTGYNLPKPPGRRASANTIRFHPGGTVWLTEVTANQILRLDPATKKFTEYPVPAGVATGTNVYPYGMAIDGNQMIWFAERDSGKVAKIDPASGEITEYDVPTHGAVLRRMGADAEGNLWLGEYSGVGKLARIDFRTAKITEYPTPTRYSGAYSVDVDKTRHLIWVNEMMADKIARFDPRTKTFVEYSLPTHYSSVRRIEVDRSRPQRVWFAARYVDKVGYLEVIE